MIAAGFAGGDGVTSSGISLNGLPGGGITGFGGTAGSAGGGGGRTYTDTRLVDLLGGSGGGGEGASAKLPFAPVTSGQGGSGGGALLLLAQQSLVIGPNAAIVAKGGPASRPEQRLPRDPRWQRHAGSTLRAGPEHRPHGVDTGRQCPDRRIRWTHDHRQNRQSRRTAQALLSPSETLNHSHQLRRTRTPSAKNYTPGSSNPILLRIARGKLSQPALAQG